jgi:hypothetical protein
MKLVLHRGNDFRPSFGRLGETRSLLPACTHYVAMTAIEVVLAAYVLQATCIVLDVSVDDGLQDKSPLQ